MIGKIFCHRPAVAEAVAGRPTPQWNLPSIPRGRQTLPLTEHAEAQSYVNSEVIIGLVALIIDALDAVVYLRAVKKNK